MPTQKIKGGLYVNVDEVSLPAEYSPSLIDGFVDEFDNTVKRPGLKVWADLVEAVTTPWNTGTRINGMFWWANLNYVLVASTGPNVQVSALTYNKDLGDWTTDLNPGSLFPVWASDGNNVWMACGDVISIITPSVTMTDVPDADAPQVVSHVAYLDGYLIANKIDSNKFYFTDPLDRTSWKALDFASAERNPDSVKALIIYNNELYLFGGASTEVWYNDGVAPFSRVPGVSFEIGIASPYTLIEAGGSLWWLDQHFRLIKLTGRQMTLESSAVQKAFDSVSDLSDLRGYPLHVIGKNWLVFTSLTYNTTLVYDYILKQWSQWGDWEGDAPNTYDEFIGSCAVEIKNKESGYKDDAENQPGTGANDAAAGTKAWLDPTYIQEGIDHGDRVPWYAAISSFVTAATFTTNYLKATGFGFAIPTTNTIDGIVVSLFMRNVTAISGGSDGINDALVKLVDETGAIVGDDKGNDADITNLDFEWTSYGGQADTWSFPTPTPADINHANFGVVFAAQFTQDNRELHVDKVKITIYHSYTFADTFSVASNTLVATNESELVCELRDDTYKDAAMKVVGTDAKIYTCTTTHTSGASTKPITGGSYATKWEECDGSGEVWVTGKLYYGQAPIRTLRRTGHITYDTFKKKRSNRMAMRLKRGVATAVVTAPVMTLRWRDNYASTSGAAAWSSGRSVSLGTYAGGADNDSYTVKDEWRLGFYRTRQYEFYHNDDTAFIFIEAEEDVNIGRH